MHEWSPERVVDEALARRLIAQRFPAIGTGSLTLLAGAGTTRSGSPTTVGPSVPPSASSASAASPVSWRCSPAGATPCAALTLYARTEAMAVLERESLAGLERAIAGALPRGGD